jgi:hypothetical protein
MGRVTECNIHSLRLVATTIYLLVDLNELRDREIFEMTEDDIMV